jgi:hypothetical protein
VPDPFDTCPLPRSLAKLSTNPGQTQLKGLWLEKTRRRGHYNRSVGQGLFGVVDNLDFGDRRSRVGVKRRVDAVRDARLQLDANVLRFGVDRVLLVWTGRCVPRSRSSGETGSDREHGPPSDCLERHARAGAGLPDLHPSRQAQAQFLDVGDDPDLHDFSNSAGLAGARSGLYVVEEEHV